RKFNLYVAEVRFAVLVCIKTMNAHCPGSLPDARDRLCLLGLDACCLEHRPPLLDLSFVKCRERLRCLLLARINLLSEVIEPAPHHRIGQGAHDRTIELADDVVRRSLRYKEGVPSRDVKSGQSGL